MPPRPLLIVASITAVFALVPSVFAAYAIFRLSFRFKPVNIQQPMIAPNRSFAISLAVWNFAAFIKVLV
jgi:ABC-type spermidine/putrescine transport system permease subunit II